MPPDLVLHLIDEASWTAVTTEVRPPSLAEQGFVHLSTPAQVHLPAQRLFAGRQDLVLLHVDLGLLVAEVRWEPGVPGDPDAMLFPHLYGPLPVSAVASTSDYRPGLDGRFVPLDPS